MNKTKTSPFPSVGKKANEGKMVILSTIKMSLGHCDSMENNYCINHQITGELDNKTWIK